MAPASTPVPDPGSYEVRPGDSLWSIAAARLGDGDDWPAIAALNLGRTMADGLQFVDPNTIHAGWTLEMPDGAAPLAPDADLSAVPAAPRPAPPVPSPGGSAETMAARHVTRRHLPFRRPPG